MFDLGNFFIWHYIASLVISVMLVGFEQLLKCSIGIISLHSLECYSFNGPSMISVIGNRPFHFFSLKSLYLLVINEGFVERANIAFGLNCR